MKRFLCSLAGLGLAAWGASRFLRSGYSFHGKSVIITGGSRGLGLTIARQLAAEGARLALFARNEQELERACAELRELGAEAIGIRCDLLDRVQSLGAVEEVAERFGGIDVLINNAGRIEVGPLGNMQREDFEKALALHFWAPYNLMQQVTPHLRRAGEGRSSAFLRSAAKSPFLISPLTARASSPWLVCPTRSAQSWPATASA